MAVGDDCGRVGDGSCYGTMTTRFSVCARGRKEILGCRVKKILHGDSILLTLDAESMRQGLSVMAIQEKSKSWGG